MEPTTIFQNVRRHKSIVIDISVLLITLATIGGLLFFFSSKKSSIETNLLGAWAKTAVTYNDHREVVPQEETEYWGFVKEPMDKGFREYYGTSTQSLGSLGSWKVRTVGGTKILDSFFYGDTSKSDSYKIQTLTKDTLVLARLGENDIPDNYTLEFVRVRTPEEESAIVLSTTGEESVTICNKLSKEENVDGQVILPITCTREIGKEERADFTYKPDGSLIVSREGKTIFALEADNGEEGGNFVSLTNGIGPFLWSGSLSLKDITFDGYSDLQVLVYAGAYNYSYSFYRYNPQTHTFDKEPLLKDVVNPDIDLKTKTISYFNKGRGLGDLHTFGTYRFENGRYILVHEENQDIAPGSEFDSDDMKYIRTVRELQNGVMMVTKTETLTRKEVFGEN